MHGLNLLRRLDDRIVSYRIRRLTAAYSVGNGNKRVYHYHVRKTAGTSLNAAFWRLAGVQLRDFSDNRLIKNGYIFVRHNKALIEEGSYFFANSHRPAYELELPKATATVTILRDPVKRILSYYRYLLWARDVPDAADQDPAVPGLKKEIDCLGGSFAEFLDNLPVQHLMTQLHMFSKQLDPQEAFERVSTCSVVGMSEDFGAFISLLSETFSLPLKALRERRFDHQTAISGAEINKAQDLLLREREFVERVRQGICNHSAP